MAKFQLKSIAKEAGKSGMEIGLLTLGALGTVKFLNFETMFPQAKKDAFFIRHQGVVKSAGAVVAIAMFPKMPTWLKLLVMGIGVEGAIRTVRVITTNKEGVSMFSQVGQNNMDQQMMQAATEVTNEYQASVAAGVYGDNPLQENSYSGVAAFPNNAPIYTALRVAV